MKLEELKQEAEQYSYDVPIYQIEPQLEKIQNAYLAGAEPREKQLEQAKKLIENIIRVTWGEGWNYSLDWKVKAEQFISEVEKNE